MEQEIEIQKNLNAFDNNSNNNTRKKNKDDYQAIQPSASKKTKNSTIAKKTKSSKTINRKQSAIHPKGSLASVLTEKSRPFLMSPIKVRA